MNGNRFHLAVDCSQCGEQLVDDGVALTLILHERTGLPVVDLAMFSHESFICEECRLVHHFGDIEPYVEDLDEDEDGEAGESDD